MHELHAERRLHLLRDDEQHARLLRLLLIETVNPLQPTGLPWAFSF
jgi:hypothetical protein